MLVNEGDWVKLTFNGNDDYILDTWIGEYKLDLQSVSIEALIREKRRTRTRLIIASEWQTRTWIWQRYKRASYFKSDIENAKEIGKDVPAFQKLCRTEHQRRKDNRRDH